MLEMIAKLLPHHAAPSIAAAQIVAKASTALTQIPPDALTLVVDEEDGSATYYAKHYTHFEWPAGASGPTIGIGYDCGYVTKEEAEADWKDFVSPTTLAWIIKAVGLRGHAAEIFVKAHGTMVTITWDEAMAEFTGREEPKWLARCRAALPGFDDMPPLCQGAIFSLSYNRGTGGYDDPSSRDAEMRAIKKDIAAKNYVDIPNQISAMRRLWPKGGDLWNRRLHEAALFKRGLG